MEVSDVLRDRLGQPSGFERMAAISLAAHVVVLGAVLFVPGTWFTPAPEAPKTIINISLNGGNDGPNNGGLSAISQRAVQTEAPPPPRPEPVRPPAAVAPETVPIPSREPPPRPTPPARTERPRTPPPPVQQAPDQARSRTPSRGEEQRTGNAIAETGARGQGFGLSSSSGTGTGVKLDITGDFCCPEYISLMVDRIRSSWDSKAATAAIVIVKYTILRDGTITDTAVERSSGDPTLDLRAQRAVVNTRQLPPLPAGYNNQSLTMHLTFEYRR